MGLPKRIENELSAECFPHRSRPVTQLEPLEIWIYKQRANLPSSSFTRCLA